MAEVVNLRMARKRAERAQAAARAAENRLAHGVSKQERGRSQAERKAADTRLDGHRIEPEDRR